MKKYIGLIITLGTLLCGIIWRAAEMQFEVRHLQEKVSSLEKDSEQLKYTVMLVLSAKPNKK